MTDPMHPEVVTMSREHVDVLASLARSIVPEGEPSEMDCLTNPELASALIRLQEQGLITLGVDEDIEQVTITLNKNPEKAKREYEQRRKPKKESKIKRMKRRPW